MSIGSSFRRSWNDNLAFADQCYSSIKHFNFRHVDLKQLAKQKRSSDTIERIIKNEYKKQNAKYAYKIYAKEAITVNQIKDIFNDIGFNVDAVFSENHAEDFAITANLGTMAIPFWKPLLRRIFRNNQSRAKMFLYQLSPGHIRLHARLFNEVDGSWYIITHFDGINWFNFIHPFKLIKTHLRDGMGNYKDGNRMMGEILKDVRRSFRNRSALAVDFEGLFEKLDVDY